MDSDAERKGNADFEETDVPGGKPRWSVERRQKFIEFRLFWEGHVNRSDLVENFGVSVPQASMDLARYQARAGRNIAYDKTAKTYVATADFKPLLIEPSADQLLSQLRSYAGHGIDREGLWLHVVPQFDAVPMLRRRVDPRLLRSLLHAIRSRLAVHVEYQSISPDGPKWRWISPHAIVFDGFRWHARAWCHNHEDFRDFVLTRMVHVGELGPKVTRDSIDRAWQTKVTLCLAPNPKLSCEVRRAMEIDFGMEDGVLEVTMRVALSSYFERLHGLDLAADIIPENRQQLVLLNREEVLAVRKQTGDMDRIGPYAG